MLSLDREQVVIEANRGIHRKSVQEGCDTHLRKYATARNGRQGVAVVGTGLWTPRLVCVLVSRRRHRMRQWIPAGYATAELDLIWLSVVVDRQRVARISVDDAVDQSLH